MKANTKKAKLLSLVLAILTALSTVTVLPFSVFAEDAVTSLTITPNYGKIENYGTPKQTFFILTMRSAKGDDDSQALYNKVRDWQATMNMTITDTTDGSVQTIKNYHVLNPGLEFVTYTYIRLSASRYGVELNPSHAYTLKIDVLENGKVTYSGTSASGAFLSTQDDFKTNGTIATQDLHGGYPKPDVRKKRALHRRLHHRSDMRDKNSDLRRHRRLAGPCIRAERDELHQRRRFRLEHFQHKIPDL